MSGQHARLSASAAHRWMECEGSVAPGGDATLPAAEGTFAHDIAAQCLKDSLLPVDNFLGKKATVDGHSVECDQEMVDGVKVYLEAVDEDMMPGDLMFVEMPLLDALAAIDEDLGGTADYVRYRPATQELLVADFKYGKGTYVEVADNRQLKLYALGAMVTVQRQGHKVKQVRSMVVQPRYEGAKPVREEVFPAVALLDFAADVREAAERTRAPQPGLKAGEHCQFCTKARNCPELTKKKQGVMAVKFAAAMPSAEPAPVPADLVAALADIPLVKEQIKALESYAYKLALQGVEIPGHKLVQKEARRKWKREGDVIEWAQEKQIDPYAPREVLSPAKLEEKVKETLPRGQKKGAGAAIEHLVERVSSGTVLVPVSDDRPAVSARITAKNFSAAPAEKPAALVSLF